jgi:RNA polymerase sigma-70 factor (ECF subfamily)
MASSGPVRDEVTTAVAELTALLAAHAPPDDLEAFLREAVLEAVRCWPRVRVTPARFARACGEAVKDDDAPYATLRTLAMSDLYLACACSDGDPAALSSFEQHFVPIAERTLRRAGSGDVAADVQHFRLHVLGSRASAAAPRIASYTGRGRLASWVRVVVRRLVTRSPMDSGSADERAAERIASTAFDPELAVLRQAHGAAFRAAFDAAFADLTARERSLLRYRYVDGLPMERTAELVGLHRVSASRALAQARRTLRDNLETRMMEALRSSRSAARSVLQALREPLEVSVRSLLGGSA